MASQNKGEDGKKGNGLGIKMHHMDLIMGKHCIEEGRERGNQASPQGVDKESNLSDGPVNGGVGCRPNHRVSTLVEAGGERRADLAHGLQIEHQRPADGGLDCGRRAGRGHELLPFLLTIWRHGNGGAELNSDWEREQRLEEKGG